MAQDARTRQGAKELALKHWKPFFRHLFESWIFPVIRNKLPGLIDDIISAQPMAAPSSQVFYLDLAYDSW